MPCESVGSAVAASRDGVWFGLSLPQLDKSFELILERTRRAETVGFRSVWLNDHLQPTFELGYDGLLNSLESWTLATALAARTETIRLGHAVLCDPFRHPALLARMAATLDVISGGRLDLGLGWGSITEELVRYGFESRTAQERSARLRETLEILDLMFRCEPFDYTSEHYRLVDAVGSPRPVQLKIPIFIGGRGPKLTLPLVREFADWWNVPASHSAGVAPLPIDERSDIGHARIAAMQLVALGHNKASAEVAKARFAERAPGRSTQILAGPAEAVASALAEEVRLGVEGFIVSFHDDGEETLEMFMEEVAPRVWQAMEDEGSLRK